MELYSHYSGKLGLICFVIWVVMLVRGKNVLTGKSTQSNNYWFVFIGMLLFSVLGFLEWDSYHYYSLYQETKETGYGVHFEPFYVWLIRVLPESYFLFRFLVWGVASLLMTLTFKRLRLNANVLAMTVPILFLAELTNTRGSLGISLMIFCSVLFVQSIENKKVLSILIAIAGIVASFFLHRSMFIFIIVLLIAYIIPMNRKVFVISLIVFPFLYGIAYTYFANFAAFSNLADSQADMISVYQGQEHTGLNINGIINVVFSKVILLLLVFSIVWNYLYKKIETPKANLLLFKYAYLLIYISFLFMREDVSNWISTRALHAGAFGLLICATHCFDLKAIGGKRSLIDQIILLGFMLTSFWRQFIFMRNFWE